MGFEWEPIDLDKGIIDISHSIVIGDSGIIIKEPNSVLLDLKEYKEHWDNERKSLDSKWTEE